jgi:phosphoribosylformimino-5-aminoimidazole carboxamide ribotide isomerase
VIELYPAIDLRGGRCVRLRQGDYDDETVYSDDPVAVARAFVDAGARHLHVVDLDAARTGSPANRGHVLAVAAEVAGRAGVQTGGGVRSAEDAEALLDHGVERVVIGTAAVEQPGLVASLAARWPGRVAAGFDHRGGTVRVRGWEQEGGLAVADAVRRAEREGAAAVVVTAVDTDGMLAGPDLAGLGAVLQATFVPVIASGGVGSLADLAALAELSGAPVRPEHRLAGVIVGKALYEGRFTVAQAVAACGPQGSPVR